MTQGAECEKTRAPNYLFARMRKNGDDKREGREQCRTSGLRRRLVRNTTHRDIQTQPPPLLFFTQYIDDTLLFFTIVFPLVFWCHGWKLLGFVAEQRHVWSSSLFPFSPSPQRSPQPITCLRLALSSHTN